VPVAEGLLLQVIAGRRRRCYDPLRESLLPREGLNVNERIYVGAVGQGVFRSVDGGQTFRRAADGMFVECDVRALAVHPRDDRALFLGSEEGVFVSEDGAGSWRRLHDLGGARVWSLLIHPDEPGLILAGTCPAGVWRSEDAGRSWARAQTAMTTECPRIRHSRVTCLLALDRHGSILAGVEIDGVHASRDWGKTWSRLGTGLSSQDVHDLALVRGGAGATLLATTNNDLNRSADGGATWAPAGIGDVLPWSYCRGLCVPYGQDGVVLLGNGDGPPGSEGAVGLSLDGGRSWRAAAMPGRSNSTVWCFARHRAEPATVYAASVSGELYRSADAGRSWTKLAREFGEIRALAWTPAVA
jgi:photosystem II stability/assembly factor-like uncharacterized protein